MYRSPNIFRAIKSRRLGWTGCVARMGEGRSAFKIVTSKNRKETSRKVRYRWEDNIIMDLKKIGINMRNWVDLTQDRDYWRTLVNAALNSWIP